MGQAVEAHAVTPPVVGIEPEGAEVDDVVGTEIVICEMPGCPAGLNMEIVLVTVVAVPMLATMGSSIFAVCPLSVVAGEEPVYADT